MRMSGTTPPSVSQNSGLPQFTLNDFIPLPNNFSLKFPLLYINMHFENGNYDLRYIVNFFGSVKICLILISLKIIYHSFFYHIIKTRYNKTC